MCRRFLWQGTRGVANVDPGSGEVASCDLELNGQMSYNMLQQATSIKDTCSNSALLFWEVWQATFTRKDLVDPATWQKKRPSRLTKAQESQPAKSKESKESTGTFGWHRWFGILRCPDASWFEATWSNHHPLTATGNLWQSLAIFGRWE